MREDSPQAPEVTEDPRGPVELDDDAIRDTLRRLGRPHRSGGVVIERASILSAGADFNQVMSWIEANGGTAEAMAPPKAQRGLHSARLATNAGAGSDPTPLRFILPASALR